MDIIDITGEAEAAPVVEEVAPGGRRTSKRARVAPVRARTGEYDYSDAPLTSSDTPAQSSTSTPAAPGRSVTSGGTSHPSTAPSKPTASPPVTHDTGITIGDDIPVEVAPNSGLKSLLVAAAPASSPLETSPPPVIIPPPPAAVQVDEWGVTGLDSMPAHLLEMVKRYPTHAPVGADFAPNASGAHTTLLDGYAGLLLKGTATPTPIPCPVNDVTFEFLAGLISPHVSVDASGVAIRPPFVAVTAPAFTSARLATLHYNLYTVQPQSLPGVVSKSAVLLGVFIQPPAARSVMCIPPMYTLDGSDVVARLVVTLPSPVGTTGGVRAMYPTSDVRSRPPAVVLSPARSCEDGCNVALVHAGAVIELLPPTGAHSTTLVFNMLGPPACMTRYWHVNAHIDVRVERLLRAWAAKARDASLPSMPTRMLLALRPDDTCPPAALHSHAAMLQWLVDASPYRRLIVAARAACAPSAGSSNVPLEAYITTAVIAPNALLKSVGTLSRVRDSTWVKDVKLPAYLHATPSLVYDGTIFLEHGGKPSSTTLTPVLFLTASQGRMVGLIQKLGVVVALKTLLGEVAAHRGTRVAVHAPAVPSVAPLEAAGQRLVMVVEAAATPAVPAAGMATFNIGTPCVNEADLYQRMLPWCLAGDAAAASLDADVTYACNVWAPANANHANIVEAYGLLLKLAMATHNASRAVAMIKAAAPYIASLNSISAPRASERATLDRVAFACVCYFATEDVTSAVQDALSSTVADRTSTKFASLLAHVCGDRDDVCTAARDPAFAPALAVLKRAASTQAARLTNSAADLPYAPALSALGQSLTVRRIITKRFESAASVFSASVLPARAVDAAELQIIRNSLLAEVRAHMAQDDHEAGVLYSLDWSAGAVVRGMEDVDDSYRPEVCHAFVTAACSNMQSASNACSVVVDVIKRLQAEAMPVAGARASRLMVTVHALLASALLDILAAVSDAMTAGGIAAERLVAVYLSNAAVAEVGDYVSTATPAQLLTCIKSAASPFPPLPVINVLCNRVASALTADFVKGQSSVSIRETASALSALLEHVETQPPNMAMSAARHACVAALTALLAPLEGELVGSNFRTSTLALLRLFVVVRPPQLTLPCVASWVYRMFAGDICASAGAGMDTVTRERAADLADLLRAANKTVITTPLPRVGPAAEAPVSLQALVHATISQAIERVTARNAASTSSSAISTTGSVTNYASMRFPCTNMLGARPAPACKECLAVSAWLQRSAEQVLTRVSDAASTAHVHAIVQKHPELDIVCFGAKAGDLGYTLKKLHSGTKRSSTVVQRDAVVQNVTVKALQSALALVSADALGALIAADAAAAASVLSTVTTQGTVSTAMPAAAPAPELAPARPKTGKGSRGGKGSRPRGGRRPTYVVPRGWHGVFNVNGVDFEIDDNDDEHFYGGLFPFM